MFTAVVRLLLLKLIPPSQVWEPLVHKSPPETDPASLEFCDRVCGSRRDKGAGSCRVISINLGIKKYGVNRCMRHELMPHALIQQAPRREARETFPQVSDYSSEAGNEKLAGEIDFLLLWWRECNIWRFQVCRQTG